MESETPTAVCIFGSSVRGPLHYKNGLPCQDASAFDISHPQSVVIAVADGLGSAARSDVGAEAAVRAAVSHIRGVIDSKVFDDLTGIMRDAVKAARSAIEAQAASLGCPLRDLACTLLVVASRGDTISVAHIGDGAIVAQTADSLILISTPGDSEYANEVVPLTSSQWEASLRTANASQVRCVAVFTDGCQRAALRKSAAGYEPHEAFFRPIFDFLMQNPTDVDGNNAIRELLESQKLQENSEDDKSLVVAELAR